MPLMMMMMMMTRVTMAPTLCCAQSRRGGLKKQPIGIVKVLCKAAHVQRGCCFRRGRGAAILHQGRRGQQVGWAVCYAMTRQKSKVVLRSTYAMIQ